MKSDKRLPNNPLNGMGRNLAARRGYCPAAASQVATVW